MSLAGEEKSAVIASSRLNEKDCGSPEVQIALLTKRLEYLSKHAEQHPKDAHCRKGLLEIVSRRKRLLGYLRRENSTRYQEALTKFGIRK